MNAEAVVLEVAQRLYRVVSPRLGAQAGAEIVGQAHSGDYTFAIDAHAEDALGQIIADVGQAQGVRLACFSEDRGLVEIANDPEFVLVVDPIDGTRPAVCGFESCCVSVAMAPMQRPYLGAVVAGCLIEMKSGHAILGSAGAGVKRISVPENVCQVNGLSMSAKTDISKMFWSTEMCGRPVKAIEVMLGSMTNASSFAGACFVFNSASYSISRIILGQLDAYVDFYGAMLTHTNSDKWKSLSRELFHGKLFGLFPYDVAAAAFLAKEAGAFVSDALGQTLDHVELLKSGEEGLMSAVVAANAELGLQILYYLETGFRQADSLT